jgi:hypothetical protein
MSVFSDISLSTNAKHSNENSSVQQGKNKDVQLQALLIGSWSKTRWDVSGLPKKAGRSK